MKKIYFVFFILIFNFNTTKLHSNENIAYVDMDFLINKSKSGIEIKKNLEKIQLDKKKYFDNLTKQLKEEENKIVAKKNLLKADEFNSQLKELNIKIQNYKKERRQALNDIQKKKNCIYKFTCSKDPTFAHRIFKQKFIIFNY